MDKFSLEGETSERDHYALACTFITVARAARYVQGHVAFCTHCDVIAAADTFISLYLANLATDIDVYAGA